MNKEPVWTDEQIGIVIKQALQKHGLRTMLEFYAAFIQNARDKMQARIEELEAENERLRALLPDAETRRAIGHMRAMGQAYGKGEKTRNRSHIVRLWLEKLESEVGDG